MFSCKRTLSKSSDQKINLVDKNTNLSETHAMLSQNCLKDEYKYICPRRNLLIMQLLAMTQKDYEEKDLKVHNILVDPIDISQMNYCTTMKNDYQSLYSSKPKLSLSPLPPEPWFLNRHTIGYSLQDLGNRYGCYTFLDDMDLHQKIAHLKLKRNQVFEILINNKQK